MPVETVYRPRLSPNPAYDKVTTTYPISSYEIWSSTGRQVLQGGVLGDNDVISTTISEIDISSLSPGLYFIYMQKPDGSRWTDKLVVGR